MLVQYLTIMVMFGIYNPKVNVQHMCKEVCKPFDY